MNESIKSKSGMIWGKYRFPFGLVVGITLIIGPILIGIFLSNASARYHAKKNLVDAKNNLLDYKQKCELLSDYAYQVQDFHDYSNYVDSFSSPQTEKILGIRFDEFIELVSNSWKIISPHYDSLKYYYNGIRSLESDINHIKRELDNDNDVEIHTLLNCRRFDTYGSKGMYECKDMQLGGKNIALIADDDEVPGNYHTLRVKYIGENIVNVRNSNAFQTFYTNEYYRTYRSVDKEWDDLQSKISQKSKLDIELERYENSHNDKFIKDVKHSLVKIVLLLDEVEEISEMTNNDTSGSLLFIEMMGPENVTSGETIFYEISYKNIGSNQFNDVVVTVSLSPYLYYLSTKNNAIYENEKRMVTWNIGNLASGLSGKVFLVVKVVTPLPAGVIIKNNANIVGDYI
jgi:uncharacterized repeat protein (TIGR01451 family)